jgi:hypothetical protein
MWISSLPLSYKAELNRSRDDEKREPHVMCGKRPVLAALWELQDYLRGGPYERS